MNSLEPPYASDQGTFPGYDKRGADYFSNTITYSMDRFELTNATAYQETHPGGFGVGLGLGPPLGTGILINGGKAHSFVNEFRLRSTGDGPWHWVGGAFVQDATGFYNFSITFPTLNLEGSTITKTKNASIFSEVSYDLMGGKLVPLIGLRYFEDKRSSESVSNGVPASSKSKPDKWTWRANLAYYVNDDTMLFFNAGTGFRSGILQSQAQADAVVADGVPSDIALTPDELRNIEIGIKTTLADGRLGLAASVYDIRYTNLQSAFGTSIGLAAFANLGDAKSQGFDLDVTWATLGGGEQEIIPRSSSLTFPNQLFSLMKSRAKSFLQVFAFELTGGKSITPSTSSSSISIATPAFLSLNTKSVSFPAYLCSFSSFERSSLRASRFHS
jgi:outer membrane receptor protein involved in Fe transport